MVKMNKITGASAPELYTEAMAKVPLWVKEESSRNGPVLAVPEPVLLELTNPIQRVLFDPIRMANPYFHVMEFIWMMAGDNSTQWISQFNKGFAQYAEGNGLHHGAYGHRWREHFMVDQLLCAVAELRRDPESRRVVLSMWDTDFDLGKSKKDLPCNTHIYLRIVDNKLNMTVCNRSNDLFWGMLGSNIVHMTMLQEVLAEALHIEVGVYRVFTNNLHVYKNMPRFKDLWEHRHSPNLYAPQFPKMKHYPILGKSSLETFFQECYEFIHSPRDSKYQNEWLENVADHMYHEYMGRLGVEKRYSMLYIDQIADDALRTACKLWEDWHR
jgi:hypothetical protein